MNISDNDERQIAKLLYRVGAFVSTADERGLWANENENKALLKALRKCASKKECTTAIQNILQLALDLKYTSELISDPENVPKECEDVIKDAGKYLNSGDINQLKEIIMMVAHDVSDANWETEKGEITPYDAFWGIFIIPFGRVFFTIGKFQQIFWDFLRNSNPLFRRLNRSYNRISYAEDQAIAQIAAALRKDIKEEDLETIQIK